MTTATVQINLNAISHNFQQIKKMAPTQKILAMIKSNAYGHGLVPVAKALSQADALGVATISEALLLREARIKNKIIVMRGFLNESELSVFSKDPNLFASIHHVAQIDLLEKQVPSHPISIWLKIDTGMHRLGFLPEEFHSIYERLLKIPSIRKPISFFSHLADADNLDQAFTQKQLSTFRELMRDTAGEKSILNSAGILAYSNEGYNWIRPGLLLYGASPFQNLTLYRDPLQNFLPAMTLQAKLIAIKPIKAGEKIGYGCTFEAPRDMTMGVVCAGYGDGYPRHAKSGAPVFLRGQYAHLVGRVSMDMICIDLSHIKNAEVEDNVTLWGEHLPVEVVAQYSDTVAYELLTRMTPRVEYQYS